MHTAGQPLPLRMSWIRHLKELAAVLVALSVILLSGGIVWALGNNPVLSCMLLGSFVIHMSTRPRPAEWIPTLLLAAALHTVYGHYLRFQPYFGSDLIHWGGFLGLSSLLVLLSPTPLRDADRRKAKWDVLLTAGALPYAWLIIAFYLGNISHTERTYDAQLLAFDSSLGPSLSFLFGRLLAASPLLHGLTLTVYHALPLGGACVLAWNHQSRWKPVRVIPMYISLMLVGGSLYLLYPAAGPAFAYHQGFPYHAPLKWDILTTPVPPFTAPRNAMPSLHFGAMLLLVWNSRPWRMPARIVAALFAMGIAFSTLALGEHYLIDLVVAFPFTMAVQAAWTTGVPLRSPRRYGAIVAGMATTGVWLAALRWQIPRFLAFPVLGAACVALTILLAVTLEARLASVWRCRPETSPERSPLPVPGGLLSAAP